MAATVTVQSLSRMTHVIHTGGHAASGHALVADEPREAGDDLGMNPYELLLAALGACTAMTLRMYADRKEWPLESVTVELSHERTHTDDCEDCDEKAEGHIDLIRRYIVVRGNLSVEQADRLKEIATRCPVHKTLVGAPQIVDELDLIA